MLCFNSYEAATTFSRFDTFVWRADVGSTQRLKNWKISFFSKNFRKRLQRAGSSRRRRNFWQIQFFVANVKLRFWSIQMCQLDSSNKIDFLFNRPLCTKNWNFIGKSILTSLKHTEVLILSACNDQRRGRQLVLRREVFFPDSLVLLIQYPTRIGLSTIF